MKVAIYGRVSTKDKGQDVENQLLQLRRFVASQPGWTICQEYTDQKSGRSADRAEFQRLFQDAYEKRFDMMLFWSLNRFSREGATDTLQHLRKAGQLRRPLEEPRNNGITEGFHNKMETINRQAYGFRNFQNYRMRIKILCG